MTCNDYNPCTIDFCSFGRCRYKHKPMGTACGAGTCDGRNECIPPTPPTPPTPECKKQTCDVQLDGRCFVVNSKKLTHTQAEAHCVSLGGHLASVHNAEELTALAALGHDLWLGATDSAVEGVY